MKPKACRGDEGHEFAHEIHNHTGKRMHRPQSRIALATGSLAVIDQNVWVCKRKPGPTTEVLSPETLGS